jgi:hypothetical protein
VPVIVDDAQEAARLAAEGEPVVLMVEAGAPPVPDESPGRVAVFVGSAGNAADVAAAEAMSVELFGA